MTKKLMIAKRLIQSRYNLSSYSEERKICTKCLYAYLLECIIKGKDEFSITFNGKYIESFPKMISDWYHYVLDNIYKFYLVHVTPNDEKTLKKYQLIHYEVLKPFHCKVTNSPDENFLDNYLEENGLKIIKEYLYSVSTTYIIAIV